MYQGQVLTDTLSIQQGLSLISAMVCHLTTCHSRPLFDANPTHVWTGRRVNAILGAVRLCRRAS